MFLNGIGYPFNIVWMQAVLPGLDGPWKFTRFVIQRLVYVGKPGKFPGIYIHFKDQVPAAP